MPQILVITGLTINSFTTAVIITHCLQCDS